MLNKASSSRSTASSGAGRRRRSPGRPRNESADDVREALLRAARDLFLRYGYRAVSSRQIASAAGANAAMIRYYFGGKPGLYREMVQRVLAPIRERLEAIGRDAPDVDLATLASMAIRAWAGNPWMAGLVVREVFATDGPLRGVFIREIAGRLAPLIAALIRRQIERGRVRADVDPELAALSFASLAAFPFVALPATSRVFGVSTEAAFVEKLVAHTSKLLECGFANEERRT